VIDYPCIACVNSDHEPIESAVAEWVQPWLPMRTHPLCQEHLDFWFQISDDNPNMEPVRVTWLDGSRELLSGSFIRSAC
jgi:hypothetical protein